jgi:bacitracin synthase 3
MLPRQVVVLDALPLTASGKVDRRALPDTRPPPTSTLEAPSGNEVERWLLGECEGLLGHTVGLRENLFDAGVTSLTAAQLIVRIRRRFGSDVPLVRVFEHPTVEALAAHLASRDASGGAPSGAPDALAAARERAERRRSQSPRRR